MSVQLPPPQVISLETGDRFRILLTRYARPQGGKGPVMMVHGISVASTMFSLSTIGKNFAAFLFENGYDVWLLDWRASIHLPLRQFTLDDAINDFPVAVDHIRSETGAETIQAVVHCIGSMAFFMAIGAGRLKDRLRTVAVSQVATHPYVGPIMNCKVNFRLAERLSQRGTTEVSPEADPLYPFFSMSVGAWVNSVHKECRSTTCHRITFMYGHVYRHETLNFATHEQLESQFGPCNMRTLIHVEQIVRAGEIRKFDYGVEGNLQHYGSKEPPSYLDPAPFQGIKIGFVSGKLNQVFMPVSTLATQKWLVGINPSGPYPPPEVIPGYGHWDTFAGAKASDHTYPAFLRILS
jgi:pimeloyl-ACP methyl ester carboxylesterase